MEHKCRPGSGTDSLVMVHTRMKALLRSLKTFLPASAPSTARLLAVGDLFRPAPVARAMRAVLISSSTSAASKFAPKRLAAALSACTGCLSPKRHLLQTLNMAHEQTYATHQRQLWNARNAMP